MKPCDSKPSRPAPWPSWKISRATPNAAPTASRFVSTPTAAITGACSARSSSRKPSTSTTPITSGVFSDEHLLEVVVLGGRATDEHAGRNGRPQAVDRRTDGRARRVGSRNRLHEHEPAGALLRGHHPGDAGVGLHDRDGPVDVRRRADELERAGRALAEGRLHELVALSRRVLLRHDLDRRHAGPEPEHGQGERDQDRDGGGAEQPRMAPEALGPGGERAASGAHRSAPT